MLVLASQSSARRKMLNQAGVVHEAIAPGVDEEAVKASFRENGISARDLADALAELKAVKISRKRATDLILGCDQTLALEDGSMLDKPTTTDVLHHQLQQLSGKTHTLHSAMVIAEHGEPVWRHVESVRLTMRVLSDRFIDDYVCNDGETVLGSLGGYHIEGSGVQLFTRIEGSIFAVLGLPMLVLLDYLRTRGVVPS